MRRRRVEEEEDEFEAAELSPSPPTPPPPAEEEEEDEEAGPPTCGKGHRSSLVVTTAEGGFICLACFSALLSDPCSPSHHVSYALSQLSLAIRSPAFLRDLRTCHPHLLVPPLVRALAASDDEALARELIDLVSDLCYRCGGGGGSSVSGDFIALIADFLSSGALAWSRRQVYMLHCFGILLNSHPNDNPASHIRDKDALFSNLIIGLQLPSEDIRGEIMFVLYKLSLLQATPWDEDDNDHGDTDMSSTRERLLHLSLEVLLKTQNDDVRMNCVALLTVLARRGIFEDLPANDQTGSNVRGDNFVHSDDTVLHIPLINLFADAIKGPLLSSDTQVQISTLDLIFHFLSSSVYCAKQIQVLVQESIADYVFEILRHSGSKDPLVISCIQVLTLLATAEEVFRQRAVIGFPTLLSIFRYVTEIPLHPVQSHVLNLVWTCISDCPGIMSMSQVEETALILTGIFRRHTSGELGMLPKTFTLACSTFVEILKSPSVCHVLKLTPAIQEASRNALMLSLTSQEYPNELLLYSLYLLKEAHAYSCEESSATNSGSKELENSIIETCETYLMPWLGRVIDEEQDEEVVLGVLETFHLILLNGSECQSRKFAETLACSNWFSLLFGFLGLFPSEQMKIRVYLMFSSVVDRLLGTNSGQPIRDAYVYLPSDPLELIFLLGQRSSHDLNLASCQDAVLLMLYVSTLYGDRFIDGNQVLASLEQYILVNSNDFSCGVADSMMLTELVHLYGLVRGAPIGYRTAYSPEAEKAVFHLIAENEWDLLSMGIHPAALKWLFQQKGIMKPLSYQILNFCTSYSTTKTQICARTNNVHTLDLQVIAELIVSEDNYVGLLLVSLLGKAIEEGREDDIMSLVNVMTGILNIFPNTSSQFCLHGITDALRCLCYSTQSPQIFINCLLLIFNILYSADYRTLTHGEDWLALSVKLLEHLNTRLPSQSCGQEEHLIISIFCLILHQSTNQVLKEASKVILLNNSLVTAAGSLIQTACAKGPALVDYDAETTLGKSLIFVLLLYFFSLKSLHATLQETMDWQDFLQSSNEAHMLSVLCLRCHDLCRLIHFGSSLIKLVASQCLVELLTRISDQRNGKNDELRCSLRYLESMMAVTEGLLFYGDTTVATNCSVCFSIILGWEKFGLQEKRAIKDSKWCRLVMEELAMTLAAPGLASRSFTNQHKPAAHVAVALLKLDQVPGWMKFVFNTSSISGIIDNLSARSMTAEMVRLFTELMTRKYMNKEQVSALHHLFQVCRKQVYNDSYKKQLREENRDVVVLIPEDIGKVCSLLIHLMLSPPMDDHNEIQTEQEILLKEIEVFFQESSRE
uniref:Protein PRD1 n=1 Tax=Elaeis guineensis var. tenera TaxID=51953 RepID=A0A6I9RXD7_ELAGV|nr:protein PRD1 [Elaeis guineensis]